MQAWPKVVNAFAAAKKRVAIVPQLLPVTARNTQSPVGHLDAALKTVSCRKLLDEASEVDVEGRRLNNGSGGVLSLWGNAVVALACGGA